MEVAAETRTGWRQLVDSPCSTESDKA